MRQQIRAWVSDHPRLTCISGGLFLMAWSVFGFYWGIYKAYLSALNHESSISIYVMMPSLVCPLFFLLGLAAMLLGFSEKLRSLASFQAPPQHVSSTRKAIVAAIILAAWPILAAPYCAIVGRIEALGYPIKSNPVYAVYARVGFLHNLARAADRFIP